jgi:ATPase subunit of ABC transporter with duplicated ATPase domains
MSPAPQNGAPREALVRFEGVSYGYGPLHPILEEGRFSLKQGMKVTLMGQNGAGKSTLFKLITGEYQPDKGRVLIAPGRSIAIASQVVTPEERELSVREFFQKRFKETVYDIDPRIDTVLEVVNLKVKDHDRTIGSFSGGQQARLLLASALIQEPDILLLDEPTNNLDHAGIEHLTDFLREYPKTCMVISHDAEFLNSFSDGVLYLDVRTKALDQYVGTYYDLLEEIAVRIEKENRKNAQLAKKIQDNKDKANFFAQKGGKMRVVAKKMRDEIEELEDEVVDVRQEDKTIRPFVIPAQPDLVGEILGISSYTVLDPKKHEPVTRPAKVSLRRKNHLHLVGPNGIGKSTLLESIAKGTANGAMIAPGVRLGYYRQDFSTLDFNRTVRDELFSVMEKHSEEQMRKVAASFLLLGPTVDKKIGVLSEGQKGLVAFAQLALLKPGLLLLDEPTNHINFRHLPVIAKALDQYEGAMVIVSHVPEFVSQIRIDDVLDLSR